MLINSFILILFSINVYAISKCDPNALGKAAGIAPTLIATNSQKANPDIGKRVDAESPGSEFDVYEYHGWGPGYVIKIPKEGVAGKEIRFTRHQSVYQAIKKVDGGLKPLITEYNKDGSLIQEKMGMSLNAFRKAHPEEWTKLKAKVEAALERTQEAAGNALVKYTDPSFDHKAGDFNLAIFDVDIFYGHNIGLRETTDYSNPTVEDFIIYDW